MHLRRVLYRHQLRNPVIYLLNVIHHLLLILITTPRQFPNLLHWLPLMISVQHALMGDMGDTGTWDRGGYAGM
jgi:hypothetical protein